MGSSPLRSDRGKKLVEIPHLPNIKSTKERTTNDSKQRSKDVSEDKKTEKQDPDVGGRKRKRLTAIGFKDIFKPQRIRIESDLDKELKSQNSIRVQEAPDRDHKTLLEGRVIDLDQREHGDCPQTKSLVGKSIESGDMHKEIDGNVSPSNGNIANSENHMVHTSSYRIEHDFENQQELDTCRKEDASRKSKEAFEKINKERDEKKAILENEYKVDKCFIYALYSNPSIRSEKLKILEREFANKLEEHERLWDDLKEVAPTFPEYLIEVANDIVSTGYHTSEKEMVDATVSSDQIEEVPAQQLDDDMEADVAEKVDSSHENAKGGTSSPDASHVEDHNETGPNDIAPHVDSADMEMPDGNYNKGNDEDGTVGLDASHVEDRHETVDDVAPEVESTVVGTPAGTCDNPDTPSVHPVSSPASDHLGPIIPEIQYEPLQPEQLPDSGVQDEQISVSNLQPSGASQLDQIIPDNSSSDPTVVEIPSEPACVNLEENLAAAAETPHEEHQPRLATSVAPAPLVNALNMFDNLTNRVTCQIDPLQAEVERLYTVKDHVTKFHQETKQRLNSKCEKEIAEIVAQIRLKYETKHLEADAAYNSKKMELETNINKVIMNRILAEAFRSKCQELAPSGQSVSQAGLMQQLHRLSVSPGQSSGNQQPPQPRPSQPPLQRVHQPAALFSSTPSRWLPPNPSFRTPFTTPIRPPSICSPSTTPSRPPLVNQITSSNPPTASRPMPIPIHSTFSGVFW